MRPLAIVLGFALYASATAWAQQARDDGGSARLQAMVQQLAAERAQLQGRNRDLEAELGQAQSELEALRKDKAGLEKRLAQMETSLDRAHDSSERSSEQVEQLRSRMDELVSQFRATIEQLRALELERNDLRTKLASRETAFAQCAASNRALYDTGIEVLDRYEDKGCFSALLEHEPFTGLKRVRLENLIDAYRWALEDQQLAEPEGEDSPSPSSAATRAPEVPPADTASGS